MSWVQRNLATIQGDLAQEDLLLPDDSASYASRAEHIAATASLIFIALMVVLFGGISIKLLFQGNDEWQVGLVFVVIGLLALSAGRAFQGTWPPCRRRRPRVNR